MGSREVWINRGRGQEGKVGLLCSSFREYVSYVDRKQTKPLLTS